jgi:hypothetical protein
MSTILIALIAIGVALTCAVMICAVIMRHRPVGLSEDGAVRLVRLIGALVGLIAAWSAATSSSLSLGRGLMLAPVVWGSCVLLGVLFGERWVRRPDTGTIRTAELRPRWVRDYLPRPLTVAVLASAVTGAILLAVATATASPDDLGRAGRVLLTVCGNGVSTASGPYPGSFYSIPLAISLSLATLLAAGVAVRAVRRPHGQVSGRADTDALRRRSVAAVVAGLGIAIAASVAGVSATVASAQFGTGCASSAHYLIGWTATILAFANALLGIYCLALLITKGRHSQQAARRNRLSDHATS